MTNQNKKPVWLLDVDQTIQTHRPGTPCVFCRRGKSCGRVWAQLPVRGEDWTIHYAPALIEGIHDIVTSGAVDTFWCTGWGGAVAGLEALWGLPRLGRALPARPPKWPALNLAKTRVALDLVRSGHPLIWTDDDAIPRRGDKLAELRQTGALLIAPHPAIALTPRHLGTIRARLEGAR